MLRLCTAWRRTCSSRKCVRWRPIWRPSRKQRASAFFAGWYVVAEISGLSQAQAQRRFAEEGPNELASTKPRGALRIGLEVVREPMFLLLIAAASLYFVMGKLGDALMLLASVLIVLVITVFQEQRTERALEAL